MGNTVSSSTSSSSQGIAQAVGGGCISVTLTRIASPSTSRLSLPGRAQPSMVDW